MKTGRRTRPPGWAWLLVLCLAAALRLLALDLKPLHSDEAVNGWFTLRLWWWDHYVYRPDDYHGPFLYYANLFFFRLFGEASDVTLRLGTAISGIACVAMCGLFRRWIGAWGALWAALLLALGPMDVYFARTNIHETWLVMGSMLTAWGLLCWVSEERWSAPAWAALGCGLMFANKETALLTVLSFVCAMGLALVVRRRQDNSWSLYLRSLPWWLWRQREPLYLATAVVVVFLAVFFSSLGTNADGVLDLFRAYSHWFEHGSTGRNQGQPFAYFAELLGVWAWPLVLPALYASFHAFRRRAPTDLFLVGWAFAAFMAYSLIPYKTAWCAINITLPLALLAGAGLAQITNAIRGRGPGMATVAIMAVVAAAYAYQSWDVNFRRYDDGSVPFVYVQTQRGYADLIEDIGVIDSSGNHEGSLPVLGVDMKNPLRWYLLTNGWRYEALELKSRRVPSTQRLRRAAIVVSRARFAADVAEALGRSYTRRDYELRPGRTAVLFFRSDLMDGELPARQ